MRLGRDRILELRVFPRLSAVGGDFHSANCPAARPSQPSDLVKSWSRKLLSARRPCDDGFWPHLKLEPARLAVESQAGVLGAFQHSHVGLVYELDSPQPLHVVDTLPTRNNQAQRITLLGTYRFAVLSIGNKAVFHGLFDRNTFCVLSQFRPFRDHPGG